MPDMPFAIVSARIFDGASVVPQSAILVANGAIQAVVRDGDVPHGTVLVDGSGCTVLPGLIDSHTHTKHDALVQALRFGVTTELDMGSDPNWMLGLRRLAAERSDVADVRSSSFGCTVLDGWPSMAIGTFFPRPFPVVASVEDIPAFVDARVSEGANYIKLFVEDGRSFGAHVPTMTAAMSRAVVAEAHAHGLLALAHVSSIAGAQQAVNSGVDGLMHMFMDQLASDELVASIAQAGIFVVPTLCGMGAMVGDVTGAQLAHDPRTRGLLSAQWRENMSSCAEPNSHASFVYGAASVLKLHRAGVALHTGTDSGVIGLVGTAHGVSVHAELALLVNAGLSPTEALRAATSAPARDFGLADRGRIGPGLRADLMMVRGDPTRDIDDSLSIEGVWRGGHRLQVRPGTVR